MASKQSVNSSGLEQLVSPVRVRRNIMAHVEKFYERCTTEFPMIGDDPPQGLKRLKALDPGPLDTRSTSEKAVEKIDSFLTNGYWEGMGCMHVKLYEIDFRGKEHKNTVPSHTKLIMKYEGMPVIVLGERLSNGKYSVVDGIHRCCAAHLLGYDKVPALLSVIHHEPPFNRDDMVKWLEFRRIQKEINQFLEDLRSDHRYKISMFLNGPNTEEEIRSELVGKTIINDIQLPYDALEDLDENEIKWFIWRIQRQGQGQGQG
jgi:hypothetical protein